MKHSSVSLKLHETLISQSKIARNTHPSVQIAWNIHDEVVKDVVLALSESWLFVFLELPDQFEEASQVDPIQAPTVTNLEQESLC